MIESNPQTNEAVTPPVGNSPKHALWGGETWTLVWIKQGRADALRLKPDFKNEVRMSFVIDPDPDNGKTGPYLYPDAGTKWFADGNKEIKLTEVDSPTPHLVFKFTITYKENGQTKTKDLWLKEGTTDNDGELQLWETVPSGNVAQPNGSAGYRR